MPLTGVQEPSNMVLMKATIEIPDELYRQVKAVSALQGRTIREVTVAKVEIDSHDRPGTGEEDQLAGT